MTTGKRTLIIEKPVEVFVKESAPPSIDLLMAKGLTALQRTLDAVLLETENGRKPERDTILNLKDCMAMLHELKAREQELIDSLSDEELAKIAKGKR